MHSLTQIRRYAMAILVALTASTALIVAPAAHARPPVEENNGSKVNQEKAENAGEAAAMATPKASTTPNPTTPPPTTPTIGPLVTGTIVVEKPVLVIVTETGSGDATSTVNLPSTPSQPAPKP